MEFIKYENRNCYKDSVVSTSYLNLLGQSEDAFIVYSKQIESGHLKINFSKWHHIQNVNTKGTEQKTYKTS